MRHPRARPGLLRRAAVGTGRGLLAGLAAGAVCGVGARFAMRIVAVAAGSETGFTIEGTLAVVVGFAVAGAPLGIIFVAVRTWLPGPRLRGGLVFGMILLLAIGVPFFQDATSPASVFRERARWPSESASPPWSWSPMGPSWRRPWRNWAGDLTGAIVAGPHCAVEMDRLTRGPRLRGRRGPLRGGGEGE